MEFKRAKEDSAECIKVTEIECLVAQLKMDNIPMIIFNNSQGYYEVVKAITTNEACILCGGMNVSHPQYKEILANRKYNTNVEANNLVKNVVKNNKSLYITDGNNVYEAAKLSVQKGYIIVSLGNIVGQLIEDASKLKDKGNNGNSDGNAWFHYN